MIDYGNLHIYLTIMQLGALILFGISLYKLLMTLAERKSEKSDKRA